MFGFDGKSLMESFLGAAGDGSGIDDFVQDKNILIGLGTATAAAAIDGDKGMLHTAFNFVMDAWSASNIAAGKDTFVGQLWTTFRAADIAKDQLGPDASFLQKAFTFGGAAAATYTAIEKWENHWEGKEPDPNASFNIPLVPGI